MKHTLVVFCVITFAVGSSGIYADKHYHRKHKLIITSEGIIFIAGV
jgi:hypothetical protein